MKEFGITNGSVIGRDHVNLGTNNQDGLAFIKQPDLIIGVICDGCSSAPYSEVGARFGAKLIAEELRMIKWEITQPKANKIEEKNETIRLSLNHMLCDTKDLTLKHLNDLAFQMGGTQLKDGRLSRTQTINDYLLFTVVGFVITPEIYATFIFGDGVVVVNGTHHSFSSGDHNRPNFISYGLIDSEMPNKKEEFTLVQFGLTSELKNIMIGTDGVQDIIKSETRNIPGKTALVGPITNLWTDPKFLKPFELQCHLNLLQRSVPKYDNGRLISMDKGLLHDDTTMIVVRKIP